MVVGGAGRAAAYDRAVVAVVFEAPMAREQAERLASLMTGTQVERPPAVLIATLLYEDGVARLTAVWESRDAWDRYLSTTAVPRGTELMRAVGAEPTVRVAPALACG
jgi:hypothetical protein